MTLTGEYFLLGTFQYDICFGIFVYNIFLSILIISIVIIIITIIIDYRLFLCVRRTAGKYCYLSSPRARRGGKSCAGR